MDPIIFEDVISLDVIVEAENGFDGISLNCNGRIILFFYVLCLITPFLVNFDHGI